MSRDLQTFESSMVCRHIKKVIDDKLHKLLPEEIRGMMDYVRAEAYANYRSRCEEKGETFVTYEDFKL
jgi:hypothetical protein